MCPGQTVFCSYSLYNLIAVVRECPDYRKGVLIAVVRECPDYRKGVLIAVMSVLITGKVS